MAILITLQGPEVGRKFRLEKDCTILGRQYDSTICLTGKAVSRQHAQIVCQDEAFLLEDLESSNGTFLNGIKLSPHAPVPISDKDTLQVGPYVFALQLDQDGDAPPTSEPNLIVRERLSAIGFQQSLHGHDPAHKLQAVLEIAQNLGRTLDLDLVLDKLLEQLLKLFPNSDRGLVILFEGDRLMVRAQKGRGTEDDTAIPFSRTVVTKALEEGAGLLSEDVQSDQRFRPSETLHGLGIHSVLCVPLITLEGRKLGVIQIDRFRKGVGFRVEDLQLLTTISLQVAVVLENVELHAQRLREERYLRELALAREIQQGFLPKETLPAIAADVDLFGKVFPARQVAGDWYDFFPVAGGKLAFFIGDVSGKGMPAALFMVAVRTLCRHLAKEYGGPAQVLTRLNAALADDNPTCLFVTVIHGVYDPKNGEALLTSAGHPAPLLRRADGVITQIGLTPARLLGYDAGPLDFREVRLPLEAGDLLFFFTDGILEARSPVDKSHFGLERLKELVQIFGAKRSLADCAAQAKNAIELYTGSKELQDDVTLLLMRRK
ncbi:MAG: SpoIIE family protein phosphatase [Gemmataceae bacterium]|nr:SpoIIE family protein phosphatase [Gemmataceae bacterium]